jgi:hypothetical protein
MYDRTLDWHIISRLVRFGPCNIRAIRKIVPDWKTGLVFYFFPIKSIISYFSGIFVT